MLIDVRTMPTAASEPYLLAIDLGTSGPKVALFTGGGRRVDAETEPVPLHLLPGGGAEQSTDDWWKAVCRAARRMFARRPEAARAVVGVGCTAQWSGTVAVDASGRALGNALIWMDHRGARHMHAQMNGVPSVMGYGAWKLFQWVRLTGGAPSKSGKDPLAHILFLKHERPDLYEKTDCFLEPKDYLNLRLTGRRAASYDSIGLHWVTDNRDPSSVRYDDALLRAAGLPREKLPPLLPAHEFLGPLLPEAAEALGIPASAKVQVACSSPDVHSAAVGSGAVADGEAHLYLGTSSWLTAHVPFQKTDVRHNMATLVSPVPGRYLVGNAQECAGACLTFLRDQVFFPKDALTDAAPPSDLFERFEALVASTPAGAGRVLFTPWLYGERTPVEDAQLRAGFHNVSLGTSRAELVRAVYEGVAYNTRWLRDAVEGFVGRALPSVRLIGGGARSAQWCQIHADVLGIPVERVEDPLHANTRGAALITAVALGLARFSEASARAPIERVFRPNERHRALHDEGFSAFVGLYRAHRKMHARLNRHEAGAGEDAGPAIR